MVIFDVISFCISFDIPLASLPDIDNPEFTLTGLSDYLDYYIVATAYDKEVPALESDYSNEVVVLKTLESGKPDTPTNFRRLLRLTFW